MYKELFVHDEPGGMEWQLMPETKDEALKIWDRWYGGNNKLNFSLVNDDDVTPELCCAIITLMRMAAGWKVIDKDGDAVDANCYEAAKTVVRIETEMNLSDLSEYLVNFNQGKHLSVK